MEEEESPSPLDPNPMLVIHRLKRHLLYSKSHIYFKKYISHYFTISLNPSFMILPK
jgi:hypothetical protein